MELSAKFDAKAIESQVKEYIKTIDLEKQIFASDKPEKIRFIEGPPTMNGTPHAGHLRGRIIKDLWYRFNTLQGKKIFIGMLFSVPPFPGAVKTVSILEL